MREQPAEGPKVVSLFSGAGGFDLGFLAVGFQPLAAFDADPIAVKHYQVNVGPNVHVCDLSRPKPFDRLRGVDVVIAGPPCQGFSSAGRNDPNDFRNDLLGQAGELAAAMRPKVIVVENVPAVLSQTHSKRWTALIASLRERGYKTQAECCDAVAVGIPQTRRRVFLFAWRTRHDIKFAWPNRPRARLDHVLAGVESKNNHDPRPFEDGSRLMMISRRIGPGQKLSNVRGGPRSVHTWNIPEVFGPTTAADCEVLEAIMRLRRCSRVREFGEGDPVSHKRITKEVGRYVSKRDLRSLIERGYIRSVGDDFDLVHTYNGKFRRFQWDDVSSTVDTRFGDPNLFLHPNEHRAFTVREAARIQGLPDSYAFSAGTADNFRLIGNAVPPLMAESAAQFARALLGQ